ncbi:hypothetical protein P8452_47841 [Trifolium repens]|nr:hypothetical protein P8452_47841 [Trifolium repens]
MEDFEKLVRDNWFCSNSCSDIHSGLMQKLASGEDTKQLLLKAPVIFGERFHPILVSDGIDFIKGIYDPWSVKGQDLNGVYCAILIVGRFVVSVGLFHVLKGSEGFVATSLKHDIKGYSQCLFGCIEMFLASFSVTLFVLHKNYHHRLSQIQKEKHEASSSETQQIDGANKVDGERQSSGASYSETPAHHHPHFDDDLNDHSMDEDEDSLGQH